MGGKRQILRGYLPPDYYKNKKVFDTSPPKLRKTQYPNKIDIYTNSSNSCYALIAPKGNDTTTLFEWMGVYSHVKINLHLPRTPNSDYTGNILVQMYQDDFRNYIMVVFMPATVTSELNNPVGVSQGNVGSKPHFPGPITAVICPNGVSMTNIRRYLVSYRGRFSNFSAVSSTLSSDLNRVNTHDSSDEIYSRPTQRDNYWNERISNTNNLRDLGFDIQVNLPTIEVNHIDIPNAVTNTNPHHFRSFSAVSSGIVDNTSTANTSYNNTQRNSLNIESNMYSAEAFSSSLESRNSQNQRNLSLLFADYTLPPPEVHPSPTENLHEDSLPLYSDVAAETEYGQLWIESQNLFGGSRLSRA
ncbi:hypothetical protein BB559_005248 [Furculomyces boomerangus]|uniref:Uncharacterized protein n=1 Tax=Furculomyces boomerangus TaxID=61424 RepID=A0A2T9Y9S5_9FUNG|nr:hypothetical protein BB559_005248 [Furculomyces boomerangus]